MTQPPPRDTTGADGLPDDGRPDDSRDDIRLDDLGHPRGTLALVVIYGVLFGLGWLLFYLHFLGRGAPHA